jgi:hypothetical protein
MRSKATEINELVNSALRKWGRLMGIDTAARRKTLGDWRVKDQLKDLNQSRDLDPSGLTTFMLLRGLLDTYIKETSISTYDLLTDPTGCEAMLKPIRAVRDVLESESVVELIKEFQDRLLDLARTYEMNGSRLKDLKALLQDKEALAWIRRDGLLSMERLEAHQFTQGEPGSAPLRVNHHVYEMWNVNSLLAALSSQAIDGVSVVLIRDPVDAYRSYFVFAIRNGQTITILTDRDEGPHPAFECMTRRPDRRLYDRAVRHHFPYQLLDVAIGEDAKSLYLNSQTGLAPINAQAVEMTTLAELPADQFVWLHLMFDRILERYGRENLLLPELSYTGEMVKQPHALLDAGDQLIRQSGYSPLVAKPFQGPDITQASTSEQWEQKPTGFNGWMEERYAGKIPNSYLNVVSEDELQKLELEAGALVKKDDSLWKVDGPRRVSLERLSPVTFGTRSKLEKDREWAARYNQMRVIQEFAVREYGEEKDNVLKWYDQAVRGNIDAIIEAVARGEWLLPAFSTYDPSKTFHFGYSKLALRNAVSQSVGRSWNVTTFMPRGVWLGGFAPNYLRSTCFINPDTIASVFTMIRPTCPEALVAITGTKPAELPWALQHWYPSSIRTPYSGNPILRRLDPQDWVLQNPWRQLDLRVNVSLCKRAYKAICRERGLEPKLLLRSKPDGATTQQE